MAVVINRGVCPVESNREVCLVVTSRGMLRVATSKESQQRRKRENSSEKYRIDDDRWRGGGRGAEVVTKARDTRFP